MFSKPCASQPSNNSPVSPSSSSQTEQPSCSSAKPNEYRTSFEDRFQQLLCVEVSPRLWLTVQRAKSANGGTYVDIRKRIERTINGMKNMIPTKLGLFLKYDEYEALMEKFHSIILGNCKQFEVQIHNIRTIIGFERVGGNWEFMLKAGAKEASMLLSMAEIQKLAAHSIPNSVFAAMQDIIWE